MTCVVGDPAPCVPWPPRHAEPTGERTYAEVAMVPAREDLDAIVPQMQGTAWMHCLAHERCGPLGEERVVVPLFPGPVDRLAMRVRHQWSPWPVHTPVLRHTKTRPDARRPWRDAADGSSCRLHVLANSYFLPLRQGWAGGFCWGPSRGTRKPCRGLVRKAGGRRSCGWRAFPGCSIAGSRRGCPIEHVAVGKKGVGSPNEVRTYLLQAPERGVQELHHERVDRGDSRTFG